jgi:hypothetical protein
MQISHLVTNGCSWTYCQGLEDPKSQGWPQLLAKKLGVPVVNLAVPGSGNDTIHRRTYEYFFEDLPNNNNPLYIIGWSQTWRREYWCRKYYAKTMPPGYSSITFPKGKPGNFYEAALLDNWSEEDFLRRTMLYQLSLDSLFKSQTVPYTASFFADFNNPETPSVIEKYKKHFDFINSKANTVDPIYPLVAQFEKLPCGHEGLEAMEFTASYFYDAILEKYKEITPIPAQFTTLKEFNNKDITGTIGHSVWE